MSLTHVYNNGTLSGVVPLHGQRLSARAELGQPDTLSILADDSGGTLSFVPYKSWHVVESGTSARVWSGYVFDTELSRGDSDITFPVSTGRQWSVDLFEVNGLLSRIFFLPTDSTANRSAETVNARMAWLLANPPFAGVMIDHGLIQSSTLQMDAQDYRLRRHLDVLNDMAEVTGYNYLLRYRAASNDYELIFHDFNTSGLDTSSVRISNVAADVDSTVTFAPSADTKLKRGASRIASGIAVAYQSSSGSSSVFVSDATTASTFAPVYQVAATKVVSSSAAATALANRLLTQHNSIDERVMNCRIRMAGANLNDVKVGQLIQAKFSHFPGWTSFRSCRVLTKSIAVPDNDTQDFYDVTLELSPACSAVGVTRVGALDNGVSADRLYFGWTPSSTSSLLICHIGQRNVGVADTAPSGAGWTLVKAQEGIGGSGSSVQAVWAKQWNGTDDSILIGATSNRWGYLYEIANGPSAASLANAGSTTFGSQVGNAPIGTTITMTAASVTSTGGIVLGLFGIINDSGGGGTYTWTATGATLAYNSAIGVGPELHGQYQTAISGSIAPVAVLTETAPSTGAFTTEPVVWGAIAVALNGSTNC